MNIKTLTLVIVAVISVSAKRDRVKLRDIETLTLYPDKWTTSRRSSPVKQLNCVGSYCSKANIQTAQCYNRGFDGNDVQWECKADMPSNYKFSRLEVSCEGYDYPDDDYILVGSCGLEYMIDEVSKNSNSYFPSFGNNNNKYANDDGKGSSIMPVVFIIGLVVALLMYRTCNSQRQQRTEGTSRFSGSWSESRPKPSAPPGPGFRPDYYSSSYASGSSNDGTSTGTSNGAGFFSGMATGGLLGYMFGSRGNYRNTYNRAYDRNSFWNQDSTSRYSSMGRSSSPRRAGGSSDISTSTGFAATKRR